LIDEFWPFVHKIAKVLAKRGKLTGDEIWEILGGKPEARRPNEEPAKSVKPAPPILMARVDGYFVLPRTPERMISPDPRACEAATRAFQRRYGGRDYAF
jgi:hypothetical protein